MIAINTKKRVSTTDHVNTLRVMMNRFYKKLAASVTVIFIKREAVYEGDYHIWHDGKR